MKTNIQKILTELYSIDNHLKKHENHLKTILLDFIDSKPDIEIDEIFVANLKKELLEDTKMTIWEKISNFLGTSKYYFAGGLVTMLLLVPVAYYINTQNTGFTSFQVIQKDRSSFGSISIPKEENMAFGSIHDPVKEDIGGVVGLNTTKISEALDGFDIPKESSVFKRVKKINSNFTSNIHSPLLDIKSFSNTETKQVLISQDKKNGYTINIDQQNETINIYANWETWEKQPFTSDLTKDDIPSDKTILDISKKFLDKYGIDISYYGSPIIDKRALKNCNEDNYIPEAINIVYPLELDNKYILDSYGEKQGLIVVVNITEKQVVDVQNIQTNTFESSVFMLESDKEIITKRIEEKIKEICTDLVFLDIKIEENIVLQKTWIENMDLVLYLPSMEITVSSKDPKSDKIFESKIIVSLMKEEIYEEKTED